MIQSKIITGSPMQDSLPKEADWKLMILKQTGKKLGSTLNSAAIKSLDFLGFFSDQKLHYHETTPFEITSDRMIKKMLLSDNERDMVVLQHIVLASYPDGKKEV